MIYLLHVASRAADHAGFRGQGVSAHLMRSRRRHEPGRSTLRRITQTRTLLERRMASRNATDQAASVRADRSLTAHAARHVPGTDRRSNRPPVRSETTPLFWKGLAKSTARGTDRVGAQLAPQPTVALGIIQQPRRGRNWTVGQSLPKLPSGKVVSLSREPYVPDTGPVIRGGPCCPPHQAQQERSAIGTRSNP